MSVIDWIRSLQSKPSEHADTQTVLRIVKELDRLEPQRARFLAAFAYVLSRVANADEGISDVETEAMIDIVEHKGRIPRPQAALVVEIAKHQNQLFGGTEDYLVTREFKAISTEEERRELLDCLFVVSAADSGISHVENVRMQQIASELGFAIEDYVRARLALRL
ncbi:MAG TPA: TerB family tellurite resistance protein [Vicinamibacterales bacterium]|jgi:uncharacterized tellurite resistance protein B-like protein|nr:TerB family tellurite resistance protein [Vicinamibacterales bacterium]